MDSTALIAWLLTEHPAAALLTVVASGDDPPHIVHANAAFEALTGYAVADVLGRSPRLLQGPRTDGRAAQLLAAAARAGRPARAVLVNYRQDGSDYLCEVALQPIRALGERVTHMLGLAREVRRRRGRPAGGERFLPVTEALGWAAFAWPRLVLVSDQPARTDASPATLAPFMTSRMRTMRPVASRRTTA